MNNTENAFVFYKTFEDQISELPEEFHLKFYKAIIAYGLQGTEPDFKGIEKAVWIPMRDIIKKQKCISNIRSKDVRTKAAKSKARNSEKQNNICICEEEEGEKEVEKDDEREREGENAAFAPTVSLSLTEYAKKILEKFKSAGLPCWNGNFLSFYQHDFADTVKHRQGIHSDDVLKAVDNYIHELQDTDSFITNKYSFESFMRSKLFNDMLPANYQHNNFIRFDVKLKKSQNNLKAEKR